MCLCLRNWGTRSISVGRKVDGSGYDGFAEDGGDGEDGADGEKSEMVEMVEFVELVLVCMFICSCMMSILCTGCQVWSGIIGFCSVKASEK